MFLQSHPATVDLDPFGAQQRTGCVRTGSARVPAACTTRHHGTWSP